MQCIPYKNHRFNKESRKLLDRIKEIEADYQSRGYAMTLRQLYYRLVASNIITNAKNSYDKIGNIVKEARLAGELDWQTIEDRSRGLNYILNWESPADRIRSAANNYHRDLWEGQDYYLEVWVEKQALESVIERAAASLDVQSFSCKGYPSITAQWEAAHDRFSPMIEEKGRKVVVIYLGDHDPSGININEKILETLELFTDYSHNIDLERIALTREQVKQYNLPPQPLKKKPNGENSDKRANRYEDKHGGQSWELDALEPEVLDSLITDTIKKYLDPEKYNAVIDRQEKEREELEALANTYGQKRRKN